MAKVLKRSRFRYIGIWVRCAVAEPRIMSHTPEPGDPYYDPITSPLLAKLSWEATPRTVIIGLSNFIPKVGEFISTVIGVIWPDPESIEKLIEKSEARM